jgi:ABC-2 type transport system permease protein
VSRLLRLVRVELTRLRYRRAILLLLAAAVLLPTLIAIVLVVDSRPPSDADVAAAERQVAESAADPFFRREAERCERRPDRYGIPPAEREAPAALEAACAELTGPSVEEFLGFYQPLDLDEQRELGAGLAAVALIATAMFLIGTTFVGHDWNTGSMSNQLLFETRRLRVWAAKALAVLAVALALGTVVLSTFWLGLYAVVSGRADDPLRDGLLLDCLQHGWRGAAVAGASALGGFALTNLFRSTVFSLGVLFGVSVAGGLLLAAVGPDDPGWLDPTINATAVISDGTTYYVDVPERCYLGPGGFDEDDPACDSERTRTLGEGVAYYGILLGAVGLASAASFRRRDVP